MENLPFAAAISRRLCPSRSVSSGFAPSSRALRTGSRDPAATSAKDIRGWASPAEGWQKRRTNPVNSPATGSKNDKGILRTPFLRNRTPYLSDFFSHCAGECGILPPGGNTTSGRFNPLPDWRSL